jgi:hypothetical protein
MADFLTSIEQSNTGDKDANTSGISSAAFKKQLKKLTKGK